MSTTGKRILVTGADGFIGSHLVEELVKQGHAVRAFVYYNSFDSYGWLDSSPPEVLKSIEIFAGDIRDPHGVRKAMQGVDAVFHLAALIGIPFSYHSPDSYVDTNIKGTLNVLQAAKELGTKQVIHTSTSEVYGTAMFVPITEEHPLQGQSPYSATKIGADQMAISFHRSFNLPVTIIRPFNTYGPRQSTRAVIPTVITQVLRGAEKIELGAVTPTRDFTFVSDTVQGFISALDVAPSFGVVINLGSNFEISIEDTAHLIGEIAGKKVTLEAGDARIRPANSEVNRLWADNSKAKRILGWAPVYAGLDGFKAGLKKTFEWFADSKNLSRYHHTGYTV